MENEITNPAGAQDPAEPKCPVAHFQQDGHMAFANPVGRANYEPNSWTGPNAGPREDPVRGFQTFPATILWPSAVG